MSSSEPGSSELGSIAVHPQLDNVNRVARASLLGSSVGAFTTEADELLDRLEDSHIPEDWRRRAAVDAMRRSLPLFNMLLTFGAEPVERIKPKNPAIKALVSKFQELDYRVNGAARWLERQAAARNERLSRPRGSAGGSFARLASRWTMLGVLLSLCVALAVLGQIWWLALVLLCVRLAGSALAGGPVRLIRGAGEGVPPARQLVGCLASHFSDVVVLWAATGALLRSDRPMWAAVTVTALSVGLFGTLARVATRAHGMVVVRSATERLFRHPPVVVALIATWLRGSASLATDAVPTLALVGLGVFAYGLVELVHVAYVLSVGPRPSQVSTIWVTDGHVHQMTTGAEGRHALDAA